MAFLEEVARQISFISRGRINNLKYTPDEFEEVLRIWLRGERANDIIFQVECDDGFHFCQVYRWNKDPLDYEAWDYEIGENEDDDLRLEQILMKQYVDAGVM